MTWAAGLPRGRERPQSAGVAAARFSAGTCRGNAAELRAAGFNAAELRRDQSETILTTMCIYIYICIIVSYHTIEYIYIYASYLVIRFFFPPWMRLLALCVSGVRLSLWLDMQTPNMATEAYPQLSCSLRQFSFVEYL